MILHRLASVVREVVNRRRAEADLHEELRAFVDMAAADAIREGATASRGAAQAVSNWAAWSK